MSVTANNFLSIRTKYCRDFRSYIRPSRSDQVQNRPFEIILTPKMFLNNFNSPNFSTFLLIYKNFMEVRSRRPCMNFEF